MERNHFFKSWSTLRNAIRWGDEWATNRGQNLPVRSGANRGEDLRGYALVELLASVAILSLIFASGVSSATSLHKHLHRARIVRSWQQALQSCLLYAGSYQETLTINIPEWLRGNSRCGNAPPPRTTSGWNSSRTDLRFYPSGVVSPASIQIDFTGLPPCIVKLSLRGRIRYVCGS